MVSTSIRVKVYALWAFFLGLLALTHVIPRLVPTRPDPWHTGETAVAGFVMALLSLAAAVSTFAARESLRDLRAATPDPPPPESVARLRLLLASLWARCVLIGVLGALLAYGAGSARAALPFTVGAAALLALHAPRPWLFRRPPGD
jgi:hypothetical protein